MKEKYFFHFYFEKFAKNKAYPYVCSVESNEKLRFFKNYSKALSQASILQDGGKWQTHPLVSGARVWDKAPSLREGA